MSSRPRPQPSTSGCAEVARELGEPLAGTAAFAPIVLALEERGEWAPNPLDSPGIEHLRPTIERLLAGLPQSRLQLIRRPGRTEARRRLYVSTTGRGGTLTEHDVDDDQLAKLDPASLRSGELPNAEAVYLVCTHGKRDRCCALEGTAYYRALGERPDVWMTSHLGGHRFAATMLALPSGLCFGRLTPEFTHLEALPDALLRGRVAYEPPVQAAEVALLQQDPQCWVVERFDREAGIVHFRAGATSASVHVTETERAPRVVSCGEPPKRTVSWIASIAGRP